MKARTTRQTLMSISLDNQLAVEFARRYTRVVGRCVAKNNDYPSKSAYVEHLLERGMQRIETDAFMGGEFRRIMQMMVDPSASEVAKVILGCHLVGCWNGFTAMVAYERFQKMRRATMAAPTRRPRRSTRRSVTVDCPSAP